MRAGVSGDPISIVQRGNLQSLEKILRRQWRLGQNIVLCWCWDERGLLVIFVPHYFLGNYCAPREEEASSGANEQYIRELISGRRRKTREDLFAVAARLGASPTFIKLQHPLEESLAVVAAVEQVIRRYGISFVNRRGVLLFDITDFSLFSPFEQASQLNSLSYSMNSAYNKLAGRGVQINFARTTTGDGYYVWNRNQHAEADRDLFHFLLLTLADNALAREASRGNTVPVIRSAFHIGSHYELYQAEGVNPTVFSYIVGDVTIELARIIEKAQPNQALVGEFTTADSQSSGSDRFVRDSSDAASRLRGLPMMGDPLQRLQCWLSTESNTEAGEVPLAVHITDKHGLRHQAFNLQAAVRLGQRDLQLGLSAEQLRSRRNGDGPRSAGLSNSWWV